MKVYVTTAAKDDLAAIFRYGRRKYGVQQARRYIVRLRQAQFAIATPLLREAGRPRPELADGLRSALCAAHVIFYRINQPLDRIEIVRIRNQRQDVDPNLFAL